MNLSKVILISSPQIDEANESQRLGYLLQHYPLARIHIRKPEASIDELERYILSLPSEYRQRYILSEHVELVKKFGLGGLHLSSNTWRHMEHRPTNLPADTLLGVSCHSAEELAALPFVPDYAYIGPVAESISKSGYGPTLSEQDLRKLCAHTPFELVALGGVSPVNAARLLYMGFGKVAMLGYCMAESIEEIDRKAKKMQATRLLVAAGLDPTAEAGLSADIRYCTQAKAEAYSIATCLTSQNADQFESLSPTTDKLLQSQLGCLEGEEPVHTIKIGLLASATQAKGLIGKLRKQYPHSIIVWDPILGSSSGRVFHDIFDLTSLLPLAKEVDLMTPNRSEAEMMLQMSGKDNFADMAKELDCDLLVKSYSYSERGEVLDALFRKEASDGPKLIPIAAQGVDRHGTGCLYSSTIAICLARGLALESAIAKAQSAVAAYRLGIDTSETLCQQTRAKLLDGRIFITHAPTVAEVIEQAKDALRYGLADSIQLRMKEASFADKLQAARAIKALCKAYGKPFIINDSVHLARIVGADGVHLGKLDMHPSEARKLLGDEAIIGQTCNTEGDLMRAARLAIDYIGLGPYRFTSTKKKLAPALGTEGYKRLVVSLRDCGSTLPVFAIGGIRLEETQRLLDTKVNGLAFSAAIIDEINKRKQENQQL